MSCALDGGLAHGILENHWVLFFVLMVLSVCPEFFGSSGKRIEAREEFAIRFRELWTSKLVRNW